MSVGLYIHIPFCRTRCYFCAFYLHIHREDKAASYVKALTREIQLHAAQNSLRDRRLDSVYFGGGTPTTLQPAQLSWILEAVRDAFGLHHDAEITVEAHPDTVSREGLNTLRRAGFNRISFGVESMDGAELVRIGRRTLPNQAQMAVGYARAAGFENINLDLIYGLPDQTLQSWRSTLEETLALHPVHLSCYALTMEEGTALQRDVQQGKTSEPDTVLQLAMEGETTRQLVAAGFQRYEISNFCRAGYACRHNLLYWTAKEYLGVGPSAQSYLDGCRFGNVENLSAYHTAVNAERLPTLQMEPLSAGQRWREAVVFGLRLSNGVDATWFHGQRMETCWAQELERLVRQGLLEESAGRLKLTEEGRHFADSVAVSLL